MCHCQDTLHLFHLVFDDCHNLIALRASDCIFQDYICLLPCDFSESVAKIVAVVKAYCGDD